MSRSRKPRRWANVSSQWNEQSIDDCLSDMPCYIALLSILPVLHEPDVYTGDGLCDPE